MRDQLAQEAVSQEIDIGHKNSPIAVKAKRKTIKEAMGKPS